MIFSKIKEAFSKGISNIFKSHEDIDEIIDETIPNDREILLTRAKKISNKKTGEI